MNKVFGLVAVSFLFALSACDIIPGRAHFTRGQPESLLSVSTESVVVDLSQRNSAAQLVSWLGKSEPARAFVECSNAVYCGRAVQIIDDYNIPYEEVKGPSNSVTLVYENIVARDCENRFLTNHNNPYNLNHPTFGCSMAVNQAQMVRDKRQFVDPLVTGPYDGAKGAQDYDTYLSRDIDNRIIQAERETVGTE